MALRFCGSDVTPANLAGPRARTRSCPPSGWAPSIRCSRPSRPCRRSRRRLLPQHNGRPRLPRQLQARAGRTSGRRPRPPPGAGRRRPRGSRQPRLDRARAGPPGAIDAFEAGLDRTDPATSPSLIYAYATISRGLPYGNFTPNVSAEVPALLQLARRTGAPVAGRDGKTGQTPLKTVLAPAFPRGRSASTAGTRSISLATATARRCTMPARSPPSSAPRATC
jgi:hypothetical protein